MNKKDAQAVNLLLGSIKSSTRTMSFGLQKPKNVGKEKSA
jgi:hypothetical protein